MTEIFEMDIANEVEFEEVTQEELIAEIEAEIEELIEEPTEEEVLEPGIEETTEDVQEEQEQEEIQVAVVKVEPKKVDKAKAKKNKMKEIITNRLNNLAKEMGAAVSLEDQKTLQSYILALLNYNAGFNSYKSSLVDGIFYEDKDIYLNKTIPDNKRGLRNGLANEILHNRLVDLQWQR